MQGSAGNEGSDVEPDSTRPGDEDTRFLHESDEERLLSLSYPVQRELEGEDGLADAHAACEHRRGPDRQPAVQQRVQLGDTEGGAPLLRHQIQG